MIVICSGMARSGSTWSFNVMKLAMKDSGLETISGYAGEGENVDKFISGNLSPDKSILVKSHAPGPGTLSLVFQGLAKTVRTYRDPRDCVASRVSFQKIPLDQAIAQVASEKPFHDVLKQKGAKLIRYEDMMHDRKTAISEIVDYLGLSLTQSQLDGIDDETNLQASKKKVTEIEKQADSIELAGRRLDRNSLLQSNHISGGGVVGRWRADFNEQEQEMIQSKLGAWATELGYPE